MDEETFDQDQQKYLISISTSRRPMLTSASWIMNPLLPISDLVITGNNEPIITVIIGNNDTVIIRNNDVITAVIIGNNRNNNT